jgi:preprotein translocase subunit YajC
MIVTTGGIYGKVINIDGNIVTLEIADKVRVKLLKSHIGGVEKSADKES